MKSSSEQQAAGILPTKPGHLMLLLFGIFLLYNLADYGSLKALTAAHVLLESRSAVKAGFYLGSYLFAIAAILPAFFSRLAFVRYASLTFAGVMLTAQSVSRKCYGEDLGVEAVQVWWRERAFASQAMATFGSALIHSVLEAGLFIGIVLLAAHYARVAIRRRWLAVLPCAAVFVFLITWWTAGMSYLAYPSILRVPVIIARAFIERNYEGPRDPVRLSIPKKAGRPKHILCIVDESVRGDILSINGWEAETTPFLKSNASILNLGVASSAANQSSTSNLILRSGLRVDQIPDRRQLSLRTPGLFQYAKAAGYRTYYLDGQGANGRLQNYLNSEELTAVDVFWQASSENPNCSDSMRDRMILHQIMAALKSGEPAFVYANKWGCHFDYASGYPPELTVFTPVMAPTDSLASVDRQTVLNTYQNDIRWSVDAFFKELWPLLNMDEVFLIYTSDHGQSIKEGAYLSTHGVVENPPKIQANVPMFLAGILAEGYFSAGTEEHRNKASAFQIFPSLLIAMGYPEKDVAGLYGVPLWSRYPAPREFLSGDVFGRGRGRLNKFEESNAVQP